MPPWMIGCSMPKRSVIRVLMVASFRVAGIGPAEVANPPRVPTLSMLFLHPPSRLIKRTPSAEAPVGWGDKSGQVIAAVGKDGGLDWDFDIDDTPFAAWSIEGYAPPRQGTEDERRWMQENRPSPRTHA